MGQVDFDKINRAALVDLPSAMRRWLPDARVVGEELVARNPTRNDRKAGSFKVNIRTGMWADFATGDRGGDPISLIAYLDNSGQVAAAKHLAKALGLDPEG